MVVMREVFDKERLARASRFDFQAKPWEKFSVERRGDEKWCVTNGSACLNTDGEWEVERSPSNRDDDFLARNRYSLDEALSLAAEIEKRGFMYSRPEPS